MLLKNNQKQTKPPINSSVVTIFILLVYQSKSLNIILLVIRITWLHDLCH